MTFGNMREKLAALPTQLEEMDKGHSPHRR
jgi:hypothetical protein